MLEYQTAQQKRKRSPIDPIQPSNPSLRRRDSFSTPESDFSKEDKITESELSFEFSHRIRALSKNFSRPHCIHNIGEYSTFLFNRQPYSLSENSANKINSLEQPPISKPYGDENGVPRKFPPISDIISTPVSDSSNLNGLISGIVLDLKKIEGLKKLDLKSKNATCYTDDAWLFPDENDYERMTKKAKVLHKKGCEMLLNGDKDTRKAGLLQLVHSIVADAKALESFRLDGYKPHEVFTKFKEFSCTLNTRRTQMALYRPPDAITALIELIHSSISFRIASLFQTIIPNKDKLETYQSDLILASGKGAVYWRIFSKLLPFQTIQRDFPITWKEMSSPQELEDGEESSASVAYPILSNSAPNLPAVISFVLSILKEMPTQQ